MGMGAKNQIHDHDNLSSDSCYFKTSGYRKCILSLAPTVCYILISRFLDMLDLLEVRYAHIYQLSPPTRFNLLGQVENNLYDWI